MRYITLLDCKNHVYVEHDEDDVYISQAATAAERAVENYLQCPLEEYATDGILPADIKHGILLFFGSLYAHREAFSSFTSHEQPAILALLNPYKRYGTIGR